MKRPIYWFGALTVGASLGLLGCEHLGGQLRPNGGDEPSAKKADDVDASVPRGEHSGGIKSGTWSSQAREIESHFSGQ